MVSPASASTWRPSSSKVILSVMVDFALSASGYRNLRLCHLRLALDQPQIGQLDLGGLSLVTFPGAQRLHGDAVGGREALAPHAELKPHLHGERRTPELGKLLIGQRRIVRVLQCGCHDLLISQRIQVAPVLGCHTVPVAACALSHETHHPFSSISTNANSKS